MAVQSHPEGQSLSKKIYIGKLDEHELVVYDEITYIYISNKRVHKLHLKRIFFKERIFVNFSAPP